MTGQSTGPLGKAVLGWCVYQSSGVQVGSLMPSSLACEFAVTG